AFGRPGSERAARFRGGLARGLGRARRTPGRSDLLCGVGGDRRPHVRWSWGRRVGYRRGRFLSANEKCFLRALDVALGRDYRAFAQVRLAELADPAVGWHLIMRTRLVAFQILGRAANLR